MKKIRTHKSIIKNLWTYALAFLLVLSNFTGLIQADGPDPQVDPSTPVVEETEAPAEETPDEEKAGDEISDDQSKPLEEGEKAESAEEEKTIEEDTDESENDELEISDEVKPEAVGAAIPAPTINDVFIGNKSISGGNVQRDRVSGKVVRATVYVTLKAKDGTVKATVYVTPKSGTNWTVNLPAGVEVAEGDTVTAYQELNGNKSPVTDPVDAKPSLAGQNKDKLTMPSGEIWIEQTSSNIVNEDEQAEAIEMLKKVNPDIANDFDLKKTKFSIDGTNHAYYEVTYTDGSTSGKVEAPNLKIKQVEEYSRGATLDSITVVDNVIKGQLAGDGPFDGIKVQIILKLSDAVKDSYCDGGKCSTDKDTSKPVDATVNGKTGEFTYTIPNPDLKLDQAIGVTVKEPHKFKSCSKTTVKPAKVGKTEVRDPRKLTDPEKKAIDTAIRKTYTVNGESKLPTGNPDRDGLPAVIQIDDSGNAKIFSPNDVAGTWDPNNDYAFVPETNEDGSYKIKDGSEPVITIPAKDLVKNIKPKAPTPALSEDKKNITFTPNEKDTDAKIITVSYKDKDGNDQTTTATKDDNGTWSITEGQGNVDANGVITLDVSNVKGGTKVTATVSDKGGIADDDKEVLTSDESELQITKAILVEALGGLSPVNMKKWVGDDLDWKDGVKAKDDAKKDEVEELLKGAKFEDVTEEKRNTSKEGDFEGKIKITFDDKSELVVEKQMLYVNNHVTSMERKDKVPTDALDVEFKLGEGTKVDNTGSGEIEGNKDNPTSYAKYKVKPNTNLKEYKIPAINTSAVDSIKVTPQEGYIDPVWRDIKNGTNFVATTDNNVFTATATKTFKVTVQPNGGTGDDKVETKKSGEKYTLPKGDTFTPPENKEFAGWLVGDATTTTAPGTEITITGDTVIKASWKPIEFTVKFQTEAGASGEMKEQTVAKGNKYELPKPTFTPNKGKEFAGWKVGDGTELKQIGEKIDISGDVTLTATWKDAKKPEPNPGPNPGDTPGTNPGPNPGYYYPDPDSSPNPKPNKPDEKPIEKPVEKPGQELERGLHERYLYGYVDGTVRPEGFITRCEAAALIARLANLDMTNADKPNFPDTPSAWYNTAINAVVAKNLMFADANGNFRPQEPITRGEFARALYYIDRHNDEVAPFEDIKGHIYEAAINQAYGNGLINGYLDGTFKPDAPIQRAEATKILNKYANRGVDSDGLSLVRQDLIHFTDIDESHWAYYEIMEAANTHEYERVVSTLYETWLKIVYDTKMK